jgi:putative thioredoxin
MLDISLHNFETDLIAASMLQPVLLDIWAPWCGPCKALGPVLERLEAAYAGRFVLAKLNSDEQPEIAGQLSQMFGVRSIPLCVLFKGGQPVDGFVGALPEAQVRGFLDKHVPSAEEAVANEEVAQAESLLAEGDVETALERLREAVAKAPDNDAARYDYLHALLTAGRVEDARAAYEPVASKAIQEANIAACGHWLAACEQARRGRAMDQLDAALAIDKRDFDARFERAQLHYAAQRFTDAMDDLLEILMRDKRWRDELARKTYVAILNIMNRPAQRGPEAPITKGALELSGKEVIVANNPVVDSYRRRLSMVVL